MAQPDDPKPTSSNPDVPNAQQPDMDEELARLRAENAAMRAQLEARADQTDTVTLQRPSRRPREWWRPVVAGLCIAIAVLLAPLSVLAVWAHDQIGNTDRYIETVAPLADDPAVQNAVINRITREIFAYLDLDEVTDELVTTLSEQGLPPRAADALTALKVPLANGVRNFVRGQVSKIIHSQAFQDAWVDANRVAHGQMVAVLSGETSDTVKVVGSEVSVNLAALIATIQKALVDNGFQLAERIPTVNATFTVLESSDLEKAQNGYALLDKVGTWLPVIAVLFLALGVYVSRNHRRTLMIGALGVALSMLALGVGLAIGRAVYLDALPASSDQTAAGVVFDTLVRFLRTSLRTVLLVFLVVAGGAFITGPSVTAVRVRSGFGWLIGSARGGAQHAGLDTGPFGAWVYRNKTIVRFVIVGVVAIYYVFLDHPTATDVIKLSVLILVLLAIVEFLARPPGETTTEPAVDQAAPV